MSRYYDARTSLNFDGDICTYSLICCPSKYVNGDTYVVPAGKGRSYKLFFFFFFFFFFFEKRNRINIDICTLYVPHIP